MLLGAAAMSIVAILLHCWHFHFNYCWVLIRGENLQNKKVLILILLEKKSSFS